MVRKSIISKRKYGKAAELSRLVSEMMTSAGEAVMDRITDLGNQNIVPAECKLCTIANWDKRGQDVVDVGNYRGLKLTDWVLKIVKSVKNSWKENRCIVVRCSLVSYQIVELQKTFLFWDNYRGNILQNVEVAVCIITFRESFWLTA